MENKNNLIALLTGLALGTAGVGDALAQESSSPSSVTLEEMVVTAERRTANVQDIPISMSAFSGDQLAKKSVIRQEDLQFASPGLSITFTGNTQAMNIRGIGSASADPDVTNGVATYIDDVFQPQIVTTNTFYDIDNIQVLRGPQGTFSGTSSTGGAIFIVTKRADVGEALNGYVKADLGNYSSTHFEGGVTLPISDTLALRAAGNYRERDSYFNSVGTVDTDAGKLDEIGARLGLTWAPSDQLEIYVKHEYENQDTGGLAYRPIEGSTFSAGLVGGIRDLSFNTPTENDQTSTTSLVEVAYEFSNGVLFKWLSADVEKELRNLGDTDATSLVPFTEDTDTTESQVSHEVNIISPDDSALQWVAGAYYQDNNIDVDLTLLNAVGVPIGIQTNNGKTVTGLFGQVGYYFLEDLQVEFGVRKAWFDAEGGADDGVYIFGNRIVSLAGDYSDEALLGKLSVNWFYNDANMIYAFVAKGYKPGGYNTPFSNFNDESVWSYEAGWKSTMMEGRLRTSLSVFYNDYTDFQGENISLATGRNDIFNIAEATIQGLELSAEGQFGNLRLDASFSYLDSDMESTQAIVNNRLLPGSNLGPQCPAGTPSNPPVCFDYSAALIPGASGSALYAPEISYTIGAEYSIDIANGLSVTPRVNYGWIDDRWTSIVYNEGTDLLESRGLLSASVTLEQESWSVQAYAKNLTDEEYVSGQYLFYNAEFYGAPREYGINFGYRF